MKSPVKDRRIPKGKNQAVLHNSSVGNVYQHALAHGKSKAEASKLLEASKKKKGTKREVKAETTQKKT